MQKPVNVVRVENWNIREGAQTVAVRKIAVRVAKGKPGAGQFHGSTNFRGTVLGK